MEKKKFEEPIHCGNCPWVILTSSLYDEYDPSTIPGIAPCMGCIIFDP